MNWYLYTGLTEGRRKEGEESFFVFLKWCLTNTLFNSLPIDFYKIKIICLSKWKHMLQILFLVSLYEAYVTLVCSFFIIYLFECYGVNNCLKKLRIDYRSIKLWGMYWILSKDRCCGDRDIGTWRESEIYKNLKYCHERASLCGYQKQNITFL